MNGKTCLNSPPPPRTLQLQCARIFLIAFLILTSYALCSQAHAAVKVTKVTVSPKQGPGGFGGPGSDTVTYYVSYPGYPPTYFVAAQVYITITGYWDMFGLWVSLPHAITIPLNVPLHAEQIGGLDASGKSIVTGANYDSTVDVFDIFARAGIDLPYGASPSYSYTVTAVVYDENHNLVSEDTVTSPTQSQRRPDDYTPWEQPTEVITSPFDPIGSTVIKDFPFRFGLLTTIDTGGNIWALPETP